MNSEEQDVHEAVQSFLSSWLVSRDLEAAKAAFGAEAFQNEAMLQQPCAGYIKPEERFSEASRRSGIDRFLRDFLPADRPASLKEALDFGVDPDVSEESFARVVNDPKADGFILVKIDNEQMPAGSLDLDEKLEAELRSRLPHEFYASFIPARGGAVYFFWVREGQTWRILHASMVCK